MISTNVKPDLRDDLMFILYFVFLFCGVNEATGWFYYFIFRPLIACCNRWHQKAIDVPYPGTG